MWTLLPGSSGFWSEIRLDHFLDLTEKWTSAYRFQIDEGLESIVDYQSKQLFEWVLECTSHSSVRLQFETRSVSNVSYLVVLKLGRWQSDGNAPTNFIVKISVALKWSRDIVPVLAAQLRLRTHNGKCQRQPLSKCVSHTSSKYTNKRSQLQPAPAPRQPALVVALLLSLLKRCRRAECLARLLYVQDRGSQ